MKLQDHVQQTRDIDSFLEFKSNIKREKATFSIRTTSVANAKEPFQSPNIYQRYGESLQDNALHMPMEVSGNFNRRKDCKIVQLLQVN